MHRHLLAQGATEYLVLLAVVLVIALVGIALLGFFPGTANDAQIAQSQIYWESASPVAIVEMAAIDRPAVCGGSACTYPYLRVRNTGTYPIRITKILGGDGQEISQIYCSGSAGCDPSNYDNISKFFYLAPGEEKEFIWTPYRAGSTNKFMHLSKKGGASVSSTLYAATSVCQNSTIAPGTLVIDKFGFEYVAYVEGQEITKKQIGKTLAIKCMPPLVYT